MYTASQVADVAGSAERRPEKVRDPAGDRRREQNV
jgi:hypothetical protein